MRFARPKQDLPNITSEYFRAILEYINARSENTTKHFNIDKFIGMSVFVYYVLTGHNGGHILSYLMEK